MKINEKIEQMGEKFETMPKISVWKIVLITFLVVCLLLVLLLYGYFHSKYSQIFKDDYYENWAEDYEAKVNASDELTEAMRESTLYVGMEDKDAVEATGEVLWDDDVINILLIGTDERTDGTYSENARGDAIMLLSVNVSEEIPVVSLVSLERGMGVPILKGPYAGQWDWLTHTFRYGGAELLMTEVSECLKVDVAFYVRVNFNIFIHAIDTLGGVTIHFEENEVKAFQRWGMGNAVVGYNHLNGEQALNYARLRYIDSDWVRIQRQREIVLSVLESCRNRSFEELDSLVDSLLPLVQTNIPESKVAEFMMLLPRMRKAETQQMTIPVEGTYGHMLGMGDRSMFAVDFETNSEILQDFLYPQNKDDADVEE